jgi:chitodextrinase
MHHVPRFVAAALFGALAGLVLVALAAGSEQRAAARVTLQIAPRGLGTVTVSPAGLDADNQPVTLCKDGEGSQSCLLTYDQGQTVTLTAAGTPGTGRSLSSWSNPDCAGTGPCAVTLEDELTSVVAVFSPLRLGVRLSNPDAGHVTTDPVGGACVQQPDDGGDQCFQFAPGASVRVTVVTNSGHTFRGWNPGCEPTTATTCTVVVQDEPTWIGARFDNDGAPGLPTTISVQFKLKLGGNGRGRVTGTKLDCGTVCAAQFDYGKPLTLTVAGEGGSIFDGWNGVCAKTQTSCTFPVGPITTIKANFVRDASPPTVPAGLKAGVATRNSVSVSWGASSDNVGVTGYRVYLNDVAAGDTQGTEHTFSGLVCGRSYAIAVDSTDAVGNRSAKATIAAKTKPCKLAARIAGVGVQRAGSVRRVVVKLRVNRATSVRLTLRAQTRATASGRYRVVPGTNALRLKVPRAWRGGVCRLSVVLTNPDGGSLALPRRAVLVPRGR